MRNHSRQPEIRRLIQSGYRYALSLSHHEQDAEDLIQQACLKVLGKRGSLVNQQYLFRTVRNLFIDIQRRARPLQVDTNQSEVADPSQNHVRQSDRKWQVADLLSRLKPEEREALYLNTVEGYSAAQIEELTGQPRNTVLSHLSRARSRLKQTHSKSDEIENQ